MSASKRAKELGAPSVRWVSEVYGCTEGALYKKFRDNPKLFDIVVAGCVSLYIERDRVIEQLEKIMRML